MKFYFLIICFFSLLPYVENVDATLITAKTNSDHFEKNDYIVINGKVDEQLNENKISIEILSPTGKSSLIRIVEIFPNGEFHLDLYANYMHGRFSSDVSGTYDVLGTVMTDDGPLTMTLTTFELNITPETREKIIENNVDEGGGCLIATSTYGSELSPQVQQLREIRDNVILKTYSGMTFMNGFNSFYYLFSPTISDLERENPIFKEFVKIFLTPLLLSLSLLTFVEINSEIEILGIGLGLIAMNFSMYFIFPVFLILKLKHSI